MPLPHCRVRDSDYYQSHDYAATSSLFETERDLWLTRSYHRDTLRQRAEFLTLSFSETRKFANCRMVSGSNRGVLEATHRYGAAQPST